MDWTLAIKINRAALRRLLAAAFASVGIVPDEPVTVLPRQVRNRLLRVLRPAESAGRRLVAVLAAILVAQGFVLASREPRPAPSRALPRGAGGGERVRTFPLFDPRLRVGVRRERRVAGPGPSIRSFDDPVPVAHAVAAAPSPEDDVSAVHLLRRFASLRHALDTLPKQARRLLRARARYAGTSSPKRFGVLRPGRPPGHRTRRRHEIDSVLNDCHELARWAERWPDKPPPSL